MGPSPSRRELTGTATSSGVGFGHVTTAGGVVVVDELSPADAVALDPQVVTAVATAGGAPLSHAAIILRSLGIPAVTGVGPEVLAISHGTLLLVDGDAGTVCVAPAPHEVDAARARQVADRRTQAEARRLAADPAVTRDGRRVPVFANIGSPEDAERAVREGADGVGMLRTEFVFLNRPEAPDEHEQYRAYRAVADALGDRPLVIRTLDLGADVPAWEAPPEANPALDHRGIRLTLDRRDLLEVQLRAVTRLAEERAVGVMFPMVTTVDELRAARACLDGVRNDASRVDVGITVEIPAAALTAPVFAPIVDFFAVGTNDLTQYTLAADRANASVARLADGLHPAVLRLIREVTAAGEHHGRTVSVVGELGTDPLAIPVLLGLGVSPLSVRPNAVAAVKELIRGIAIDGTRS
ncbi:MAG: phosphoenolpyruvate--protein phosphotransferase, partial [Acidimicrobiales bacterium]